MSIVLLACYLASLLPVPPTVGLVPRVFFVVVPLHEVFDPGLIEQALDCGGAVLVVLKTGHRGAENVGDSTEL